MSVAGGIQGLHFINTMNNAGLKAGAAQAKGIVSGLAGDISRLAPFAPLAAGALILGKLADDAYDFSNEFSKAMREVQTISVAVQEDWEGMSQALIDLAANGPDDAIELAKAYYQIVSAGYDGAAGLNLLDVASRAATAGITDTKTAADGLTTILNAWGKDASEAENVADILFKTVEKGKTTFPELAQNIATVAPMAAAMGISLEEITGAIATLTKQGNTTPVALTQIRQAIIALNENLGDGWSKAMTLQEGLQELRDMAGGSDTKLKEMTGRVEGMNAVLSLTGDKAKEAAGDLDTMTTATGSMQTAYDTMMLEADNKWSQVHNKWQRELNGIGTSLKVVSTGFADVFNALLTNEGDLGITPPAIGSFEDKVAGRRMLGDSRVSAWINAMISSKSGVENSLYNILDRANEGFDQKEGQLSQLLGIEDAKKRAEELKKFLDQVRTEGDQDSQFRYTGEGGDALFRARERNWENLIKLIEDAIKKANEFDSSEDGGDGPVVKPWNVAESLANIEKLKEELGKGDISQEIEVRFKIANEQEKINQFAEKFREAFEKAVNESWDAPFSRSVGADGTNSKIETTAKGGLDVISQQAEKYREQTRELAKQLKPKKQLTDETEKQLKAETAKLDAQRDQEESDKERLKRLQEEHEKTMALVHGTTQILDATSRLTSEYGEQLGLSEKQSEVLSRSLSAMGGITRMASGDIIGGATQLVSSALDLFLTAPEKLSEQYAALREQINSVIEAARLANDALTFTGNGSAALSSMALIQQQLTGLLDDAKRLNEELPDDNERYGRRTGETGTDISRSAHFADVRAQMDLLDAEIEKMSETLLSGGISEDDQEAIKELLSTYNSLLSEVDSITQSLIGTSISELSNSLADAFLSGEDAAEQWGDKVNDIVKNITKNKLITGLLTEPIQAAVDQLIKDMGDFSYIGDPRNGNVTDVGLTDLELQDFLGAMNNIYDDVAPEFQKAIDALGELGISFGGNDSGYSELKGITRSLTEETGSELVGQLMAQRMHLSGIDSSMMEQLSIAEDSLEVLRNIETNTSHNTKLNDIDEKLGTMNATLKEGLGV